MNISKCKHCKVEFDISDKPSGWMGNHSRWCYDNPKRKEYVDTLRDVGTAAAKKRDMVSIMNASRKKSGRTNQFSAARLDGKEIPESPLKGRPGKFKGHSEKTKQLLREKALSSPHRRLKKGMVEYKGIMLDSHWELELAKRLDELKIKWVRPKPIPWVDKEGITHNYFPDFYLEDYDLFLDPKNPHAVKVQQKKLDSLLEQYKNIIIIESIEECRQFTPEV